jgi:hypothetical protein
MADKIQHRRDTLNNWEAVNPTLSAGEPAWVTDRNKRKVGDGSTPFSDLPWETGEPEGWVNVKDFGAKGDGVTDDTQAIQNAINSIENPSFSGLGGVYISSRKVLYFPKGRYKISSTITIYGPYLTIRGSNSIIETGTFSGTHIFNISSAYMFHMEGFIINSDIPAIRIYNSNLDRGKVAFTRMSFEGNPYAIDCYGDGTDINTQTLRSTQVLIDNCRFSRSRIGKFYSDGVIIQNSWISAYPLQGDGDYQILNANTMTIRNLLGVPNSSIEATGYKDFAWIQNEGPHLYIEKSRFGAEFGGMTVVNQNSLNGELYIENSRTFSYRPTSDNIGDRDSSVIRLFQDAKINLNNLSYAYNADRNLVKKHSTASITHNTKIVLNNILGFISANLFSTFSPNVYLYYSATEFETATFFASAGETLMQIPKSSYNSGMYKVYFQFSNGLYSEKIFNVAGNGSAKYEATIYKSDQYSPNISIVSNTTDNTWDIILDDNGYSSNAGKCYIKYKGNGFLPS